jgi:hypothetical protein
MLDPDVLPAEGLNVSGEWNETKAISYRTVKPEVGTFQ